MGGRHGTAFPFGGCGDFRYYKPRNNTSGDQIVASVAVETGEIVPAEKISVTLDGRVINERIK